MKQHKQAGFTLPHILMVVALIGVISGVGVYVYKQNQPATQQNRQDEATTKIETKTTLPDDLSGLKSVDEIKTTVEPDLNGATIVGVELEMEDGALIYKVKLSDGRVLFFDAATGDPTTGDTSEVEDETESEDSNDTEAIPDDFVAGITIEKAREIAEAQRPGQTVKKIEFEVEEGVAVYSVRFTDGSRVDVSATDGTVVRVKEPKSKTNESSQGGSSSNDESNETENESHSGSSHGSSSSGSGSGSSSNSGSGSSSQNESEDDDDDATPTTTPSSPSSADIGEAAAKDIANNRLPGKTIEKVETETEGGVKVYSIRFTDDSRVDVRATDGAVLRVDS